MNVCENKRWQAPGNGKGFDSTFEKWNGNKMSERSIGALQYIMTHPNTTQKSFENGIWNYLNKMYNHQINGSCKSHFFRPVEFFGFIRHFNNLLSVSYNGRNFIKELEMGNFDRVRESFILQLFNAKYPNTATKDVQLGLYPFRIIFKLFIENQYLTVEDFEYKIPYIWNATDCYDFKTKNSNLYKRGLEYGRYDKFKTWVINSFVDLGIIVKNNNIYEMSPLIEEFIYDLVNDLKFEDMFFTNEIEENFNKNKISIKLKRDNKVIEEAIKINNCKCYFDDNHITFKTYRLNNFVEGHHIIPMGRQKSFSQNLDVVDNVIPLCPNCHRMIHLAKDDDKIECIKKIISRKDKLQTFNEITKEDLFEFYCLNY